MSEGRRKRAALRLLAGLGLALVLLAVLVPWRVAEPERALEGAVAQALAAEHGDQLLQTALEQYPDQAPAIAITYGRLALFREQLARFGPQVVPILAAYQESLTTADLAQLAKGGLARLQHWLSGGGRPVELEALTREERGMLALLKMRDRGNGFVGLWEITPAGEAHWVPSRLVTLGGVELLFGGLTGLELAMVQGQQIDWQTLGLAAVDLAAIASGVALLRFANVGVRGAGAARAAAGASEGAGRARVAAGTAEAMSTGRAATATTSLRSGALAAAGVLGVAAVRYGVLAGLIALMVLHPQVFTHTLWVLAESLGLPGVVGPLVGWGVVLLPLACLASWLLLSARALGLAARGLGAAALGCRRLAG